MNYCKNCGKSGHSKNKCKQPIISCGNIIFRKDDDKYKILMILRKDSICYIELIRGKYNSNDKKYIQILIDNCSSEEKEKLKTNTFSNLWKELWTIEDKEYMKTNDYKKAFSKFKKLYEGITFNGSIYKLIDFINYSKTNYQYSEWEIPKGKRKLNETDLMCACREFQEETGYNSEDYAIIQNIEPISENFKGLNNYNYKYIYYFSKLLNYDKKLDIDKNNYDQYSEIKDIRWFTEDDAIKIIRKYHTKRISIIKDIFLFLKQLDGFTI